MADKFKACSVDGCNKNAHQSASGAKGWCRAHYTRWSRYGDPTVTIGTEVGAPLKYFYEKVLPYRGDECLTWPYNKNGAGQGSITYEGQRGLVTRLVCSLVYGPPPTAEHHAAHSCGNGHLSCVAPNHLRWATPKENAADKYIHGTHPFGEAACGVKLTTNDVLYIISMRGKVKQKDLAIKFGVSTPHICSIQKRKFWKHLTSGIETP